MKRCSPADTVRTGESDARGEISWAGLEEDCYNLVFGDGWYGPRSSVWALAPATLVRVPLERRCPGEFVVVDETLPVAGATVDAIDLGGHARTGSDGRVAAPERRCGRRTLSVIPPDEPLVSIQADVESADQLVTLSLPRRGTAETRFVDGDGGPVPMEPPSRLAADWEELAPGHYRVSARSREVNLVVTRSDSGEVVRLGLPLDGGLWTVVLPGARERRTIQVEAQCDPEGCPPEMRASGASCAGTGPSSYRCECAGECVLTAPLAAAGGMDSWMEVGRVFEPDDHATVDVRSSRRGTVSGLWIGAPDCLVRLRGPSGRLRLPCLEGRRIQVDGLVPGSWQLVVENPGFEAAAYDLDLQPGDHVDLGEISPEPGEVHGRVEAPGLGVSSTLETNPAAAAAIDPNGDVLVRGLPAGTDVELTLWVGRRSYRTTLVLVEGFRWDVDTSTAAVIEGAVSIHRDED